MKNFENLLEAEITTPLPRVMNGFRFIPVVINRPDLSDKAWIWRVRPNRCSFDFYFASFRKAAGFFVKYENNHTENFWWHLYQPVHFFRNVSNFVQKGDLYE